MFDSYEQYEQLQKHWDIMGCTSLKDLLIEYNIADVEPFVTGVERMKAFYEERGINCFKESVTLAGIARVYGFNLLVFS